MTTTTMTTTTMTTTMTTDRATRPGRPNPRPMRLLLGATALGTIATFAAGIGTQPPGVTSAEEAAPRERETEAATYLVVLGDRPVPAAAPQAELKSRTVSAPERRRNRARTRQSG
jgi:hypothetical protein